MRVTNYESVNKLLSEFSTELKTIFGNNLKGLYLTGSLSYGDFNLKRSDIDLVVILQKPASDNETRQLRKLHKKFEERHSDWEKRIECSYIPREMFENTLPPKESRPYYGEGKFYSEAPYGNEWLINKHLLYEHGITLLGPDIKSIIKPVDMDDVKKACIKDLHQEWKPKISKPEYFKNSHYQSYVILNICRILYTVKNSSTTTKAASTSWVKENYPKWKDLIEEAENWGYGDKMDKQNSVIDFIKFALTEVPHP